MTPLTYLSAAILLSLTLSAHAAPSDTPQFVQERAQLLYPDGKPDIDATAIIDLTDVKKHNSTLYTAKPDSLGNVIFTLPYALYSHSFETLYATSPTGIGFCSPRNLGEIEPTIVVPFTRLHIHLVDSTGKAVSYVKIGPTKLRTDYCSSGMYSAALTQWDQTTDGNGDATLTGLPQGYDLTLDVDDDRYAIIDARHPIQLADSAVTPDTTIQLSASAILSGRVLFGQTIKPVAGIEVDAGSPSNRRLPLGAETDSNGAFTIKRVPAGAYDVALQDSTRHPYPDWVGQGQTVNATAGQTTTIILNLVHGGIIAGTITDQETGKPISNVDVSASQNDPALGQNRRTRTRVDGRYSFHMLPGTVFISVDVPSVPYRSSGTKNVVVADKATATADFRIDPSASPKALSGLVLGPDGKPVAGAEVSVLEADSVKSKVNTDAFGRFTLDSPGVLPKDTIFALWSDLSTPSPVVVNGEAQLILHLKASDFCTLTGKVEDQNGTPVPNAAVALYPIHQSWLPKETAKTDANGMYAILNAYANVAYLAHSGSPGYWYGNTDPITCPPGQTTQLPTIVIRAASSFIAGTVLGATGKPAANVLVSCDDNPNCRAYTDQSGRFMLRQVPSGAINLLLQPIDYNFHIHSQAVSGQTDNIIHLPPP